MDLLFLFRIGEKEQHAGPGSVGGVGGAGNEELTRVVGGHNHSLERI
jgi:hypothetical protein